jgi:hypothetical protein
MLGRSAAAATTAAQQPAAALSTAAAAASGSHSPGPASVTLPNGKTLELPDGGIKFEWPAEWAPHAGTWLAWPKRSDVWRSGRGPAREAFTAVITAIAEFEPVTVIADPSLVRLYFFM